MVPLGATEKSIVTPRGIDPGNSRLVAQCLNHYAMAGPKDANNMTINQRIIWLFTVHCQPTYWDKQLTFIEAFNWTLILCHTHSHITNPVSHPQSHHKSCVTPTVTSQILCPTHSLITNPVSHPVTLQILCHTNSLITNPVSHPQSYHKSCATLTDTPQILCHTHSHITNPVSHPPRWRTRMISGSRTLSKL